MAIQHSIGARDPGPAGVFPRRIGAQVCRLTALLLFLLHPAILGATDLPHTDGDLCASCHMVHNALGGPWLNVLKGNTNLCQSCHLPGGAASGMALLQADQALPGPGLPVGSSPVGTSHRWDSSAAGHVGFAGGSAAPSTGTLKSTGAFTGPYAKTYTLVITTSGNVGTATFNWTATTPGGGNGTNVTTGANITLDEGIAVTFADGTGISFQQNDRWQIFVRPGLRQPVNPAVLQKLVDGQMMCSTCHNPHSQQKSPFDPNAPPYVVGGGAGRHYQIADNSADQVCLDCHASRNVSNAAGGSHPVGVPIPADATHKAPALLPLGSATGNVLCQTCHEVHFSPSNDGSLARLTDRRALCTDCHTLADTTTPARHLNPTLSALWPGGQYGTTFPAITNAALRGACENCHQPHGWPVATAPSTAYPKLLVDHEENLCFTCHDTNGPAATNVQTDFTKLRHHPVLDSEQAAGRGVECSSCHNPHKAIAGSHTYATTANLSRNLVSNVLRGADGVAFNYTGLTNFQTVPAGAYTYIPKSTGATYEYQICFKCHTGYAWGAGTPPNGLSPNGSVATPVETDAAQEFSPMNKSGHPIMTGLNNYPNSTTPKPLAAAALKAPWNTNMGNQTMMCSDCHNTDASSPAAQGPHGSAYQFMLRGPNAANWPNVVLSTGYSTSWCANCHNNSAGMPHTHEQHRVRRCYECHIVIPHGGKLSRLIADGDSPNMPARYAYNNNPSLVQTTGYTKRTTGNYTKSNCGAKCHLDAHPVTNGDQW